MAQGAIDIIPLLRAIRPSARYLPAPLPERRERLHHLVATIVDDVGRPAADVRVEAATIAARLRQVTIRGALRRPTWRRRHVLDALDPARIDVERPGPGRLHLRRDGRLGERAAGEADRLPRWFESRP